MKGLNDEEVKTCLVSISQLKNLEELSLNSNDSGNEEPSGESIAMIGQNCAKLAKLSLNLFAVPTTDHFLESFSSFKSLISLNLSFNALNVYELKGSVKSLSGCTQLKHLLVYNTSLSEDFFSGIDTALPNLQTLYLGIGNDISDSFISPFLTLKFIQKVIIKITFRGKYHYYFGKLYNKMKLNTNDNKTYRFGVGGVTRIKQGDW